MNETPPTLLSCAHLRTTHDGLSALATLRLCFPPGFLGLHYIGIGGTLDGWKDGGRRGGWARCAQAFARPEVSRKHVHIRGQ
jgi:hypothetical protein